jgi:hypothetical protein
MRCAAMPPTPRSDDVFKEEAREPECNDDLATLARLMCDRIPRRCPA